MTEEGYLPCPQEEDVAAPVGEQLHQRVPFQSWCVTWQDLLELRQEVQKAIREERLKPTRQDPFDPSDERYGPSIYTVVEQLIKPRTKEAGNMSWALMKHPQGLPCDVFVTHAWEEGVFEFLDKVLDSWPFGARHAYCCMLSNPQNLNIEALISDPLSSPFAYALEQAEHMLVVPNRRNSIYTRIWCAFEAHLGVQLNKRIATAFAQPPGFWIRQLTVLVILVAGSTTGAFFGHFSRKHWSTLMESYMLVAVLLIFVANTALVLLSFGQKHQRMLILWLTAFGGIYLGILADYAFLSQECRPELLGYRSSLGLRLQMALWIPCVASCILLLEADRQWGLALEEQSFQLYQNFTGVADARSSEPKDKVAIMTEISNQGGSDVVDAAVQVLIRSGVSTPELRELARHRIQVENAGMYKTSLAAFALSVWFHAFIYAAMCVEWGSMLLLGSFLAIAEALLWLLIWSCSSLERRAYGVWTASMLITPVAYFSVWITYFEAAVLSGQAHLISLIILWFLFTPLVIYSTLVGPAHTLKLPLVGPMIVRHVLGEVATFSEAQQLLEQRILDAAEAAEESPVGNSTVEAGAAAVAVPKPPPALRKLRPLKLEEAESRKSSKM